MELKWLQTIYEKIEDLKNTLIKDVYDTNNIGADTDSNFKNFCEDLKIKEDKILIEVFALLNFSILEGEFIQSNFIDLGEKIIKILGSFYKFPDLSFITDLEEEGKYNAFLSDLKFLNSFTNCIEEYINSAKFINRIFSESQLNKNLVIDLSDKSSEIIEELNINDKKLEKILVQIFSQNLFLSRKEFTLRNNENNLEKLLNSKHILNKCESDFPNDDINFKTILSILKDKITFLTRKLIIRKYQEPKSENQYYVLLGKENNFNLENHKFLLDIYKPWDEYSQQHFLSEKNLIFERELNNFCDLNKIDKNFWSTHRYAKKYKDLDKDLKKLETLSINSIIISNNDYNNFSQKISNNYLKNCSLSLSVEKEIITYNFDLDNFLEKENRKINLIQSESIISNFFPFKKVASFIVSYINYFKDEIKKENLEDDKLKIVIEKIKNANNHLTDITTKYKSNLLWCKNHFFYSYQLPIEESIYNYKTENLELNIFSNSTFSLPLDFDELIKEVEKLEVYIENNENDIKSLSNFSSLFIRLNKKISEQEKDIKENSKKSIELLSVFTAILALIFGGISTASDEKATFENKFLTFISLFIVLFSFITLVKTFISKEKSFIEIIGLFFIYLIALIMIIFLLSITIKQNI